MADRIEIDPAKPQAFMSYARDDDKFLDGAISRLRIDIEEAVGFVSARPFKIFQDTDGIGFGQDWLDRLEEALRQARFLIPILTPRYFASEPCRAEAFRFLEYEAAARRKDLILPIYLQDTPLVDNTDQAANDDLAIRFAERQYRDWRHLAFEPAGSSKLRAEATELAREISAAAARAVVRATRPALTPPDDYVSLEAELAKREQSVEAERARIQDLEAKLSKWEQEAKQLAEERAVFQGQAEEASNLKREVEALKQAQHGDREALTVPRERAEPQQPVPEPAGFRPLHAIGIAGLALLIGGGGGWLLGSGDINPEVSTATVDTLQRRIEALEGQVDEKKAEVAGFEAKIEEMMEPGLEQGRVTDLTNEISELRQRLEISEQRATALDNELVETRRTLAAAQTSLERETLQATSQEQAGQTFRDCDDCPMMVSIPAGDFLMGSAEGEGYDDERPQHEVTISKPFALGQYEVTFAEWDACVASGGCDHKPNDSGWGRNDRPVIDVSWYDAQQYCGWLSKITARQYRLPSEAEWEYAARAGSETAYFWGNEIGNNFANCNGCGSVWDGEKTAPVGRFIANLFGVYDMHGNVWEWVQDVWHATYDGAPADGSAWTSESGDRVVRGGAWGSSARVVRAAGRDADDPSYRYDFLGFRCARVQE